MSLHPVRVPTRDELVRAYSKPIPRGLTLTALVLAGIGVVAFVVGLMSDADRAWRAYHVSWLFFTSLSSAGVLFVAVQRITTARWSRAIIRFEEGYVAFLPVAFVLLLLTLSAGKAHIFPWTHETAPVHEKVLYYNAAFLTARVLIAFGVITALSLWIIYTSVRLDVGLLPEAGAAWADSTTAEIRFLKSRLKLLEEKVSRQDRQIRGVAKLPAMPPGEPPVVCKDAPCPAPPPPVFVSFKNGLKVESWDQAFSFKIGGRIFVDGGVNDHPIEAFPGIKPFFP